MINRDTPIDWPWCADSVVGSVVSSSLCPCLVRSLSNEGERKGSNRAQHSAANWRVRAGWAQLIRLLANASFSVVAIITKFQSATRRVIQWRNGFYELCCECCTVHSVAIRRVFICESSLKSNLCQIIKLLWLVWRLHAQVTNFTKAMSKNNLGFHKYANAFVDEWTSEWTERTQRRGKTNCKLAREGAR